MLDKSFGSQVLKSPKAGGWARLGDSRDEGRTVVRSAGCCVADVTLVNHPGASEVIEEDRLPH